MSDGEKAGGGGPLGAGGPVGDDDVGLPRATVHKLVQECLPAELVASKEMRDLIGDCGKEFITLISSEANDICEKEAKKTISPEHINAALKQLGFDSYIEAMDEISKEHKVQVKETTQKKRSKFEQSGLTEEELAEQQERLFAASRARFDAQLLGPS